MKICILSSIAHEGKIKEDISLKNKLLRFGVCDILAWEKITKDIIGIYDIFIIRSVWGYHKQHCQFIEMLNNVKTLNKTIVNGYENIIENISKENQFNFLKQNNIPTIPTIFVKNYESQIALKERVKKHLKITDDARIIAKPAISASGNDLINVKLENLDLTQFSGIINQKMQSVCVQPFIREVLIGEYSAVVVNNQLQYVVKRFPGVVSEKKEVKKISRVSSKLKERILQVIKLLNNKNLTFYRIDFFKIQKDYYVNEIEMMDPDLFTRKIKESDASRCLENLALTVVDKFEKR